MKDIVLALRDYIATGERPSLGLGPWPAYLCEGDLWGYGAEAMDHILSVRNNLFGEFVSKQKIDPIEEIEEIEEKKKSKPKNGPDIF